MLLKKIFKNLRVWVLIVFLFLSLIAIHPVLDQKGVALRNIAKNSSAFEAGFENPNPNTRPTAREKIISINNNLINSISDYNEQISKLKPNQTISIVTQKKTYSLKTRPIIKTTVLNETEFVEVQKEKTITELINGTNITRTILETKNVTRQINRTFFNKTTNLPYFVTETITEKIPVTHLVERNKVLKEVIGMEEIGIKVYEAPKNNIRKGLDLQGGTRVVLQPEEKTTIEDLEFIIENMKQRLNVFGVSDVVVTSASDLPTYLGGTGNDFIIVEIAGTNEEEVKELLAKQGKFEAKIGNDTVFKGGRGDIPYVCRTVDCSGIDPSVGCQQNQGQWSCRFSFSITLSPGAAKRQAELTKNLDIISSQTTNRYLSKPLDLYLDNELVDSLNIGEDLKGRAVTSIAISGSDVGVSNQDAVFNSLKSMKHLQTILVTGSLPVKLEIVKTDSISPTLGAEFVDNAIYVGLLAALAIVVIVSIRYRKIIVSLPMLITSLSEVILILGAASIINWNLDLASIAGIIIVIGTGIDQQIIITDELLRGGSNLFYSLKDRIKNALFIIMASYLTTVVAMMWLWGMGAGLLKGFAITTIIGISIGVFITRPAYAAILEMFLKE